MEKLINLNDKLDVVDLEHEVVMLKKILDRLEKQGREIDIKMGVLEQLIKDVEKHQNDLQP